MDAFRSGRLVYIPIPKIASSSYRHIFGEVLGWESVQVDQIDWYADKVFSHIMDPLVRHAKGSAECVIQYDMLDVVEDPKFQKLLATCVFDIHSYPIVQCFGPEACNRIDWIPIDHPEISGNALTNKFLKYQGIDIDVNSFPALYTSDNSLLGDEKRNLSAKILKLHKTFDVNNTLSYFYDRDIVLYNNILVRIQWWQENWDQITWLKT